MLIVSNAMYYRRTRDKQYGRRFWLGKDMLTRSEYLLNRIGLVLALLGIALMLMI